MVTAMPEQVGLLPGMKPLIEELSANFKLYLVSDYPRRWLKRIVENTGLVQYFKDDDTLVLAEEDAPHTYPELFESVARTFGIQPGSSLWIDHSSPHTSWAIRQGIDAIVFVDAQRLRRELGMRNLLPKRSSS
jgi:beta-phosphoglucomutase-like phosphatase (HAD superfamily)